MGDDDIAVWNEGYLSDLHARFLRDPCSVDPETRSYLKAHFGAQVPNEKAMVVAAMADAIRDYGYLKASVDPLAAAASARRYEPLLPASPLSDEELDALPASLVPGSFEGRGPTARSALRALERIYCSSRGYDYRHLGATEQHRWLVETAESGRFRPPRDPVDVVDILKTLTAVEAFETFLQRMLPGRFRFSIEGVDMLVPLLEEIIGEAAEGGVENVLLGMAHRGRLNVLVHVLGRPATEVMARLRGAGTESGWIGDEDGYRGDVTYHMGARRARRDGASVDLVVTMPPNPSHVEAIDPVVAGMARAAASLVDRGGSLRLEPGETVSILVHGDAAFPGQGVVAETLNLARLPGYHSGGVLHVIANNGLGFTTDPEDLHGGRRASDLAKGFDVPVLHVNADDPEAVVEAGRTAVAFLNHFHEDFVIDLVGYRRRGHNEADEPGFTQPRLYRAIEAEPTVREKWIRELSRRGILERKDAEAVQRSAMDRLREAWHASEDSTKDVGSATEEGVFRWSSSEASDQAAFETEVPLERLRELHRSLLMLPPSFHLHPKLQKVREKRKSALEDPEARTLDWGMAEELAFSTILADGTAIRLTGEDVERGTFSQRHSVLIDFENGEEHVPLQSLSQARAAFEVQNSPLTENAALGFEVGYSLAAPERMTIWEAQYGDFVNGAQVVIDELIASAGAKWRLAIHLVLLLPHGHEGHGPDHSSARPERFLSLCANGNLWVANPTTAAQYFHLLRLQAARIRSGSATPLVVFSPKTLLRAPVALSAPRDLSSGAFRAVLPDPRPDLDRARVRRMVLVSGKLYAELARALGDADLEEEALALCRLEQLYPWPRREVVKLFHRYPALEEVVWAQEEPENMGGWPFVQQRLADLLPPGADLAHVARDRSSTPAEGSRRQHERNQTRIVSAALRRKRSPARKEVRA